MQTISKNFERLEKWGDKILLFIHENGKSPDKEEAWKIGIPIDFIDFLLRYINIQVKEPVLHLLSTIELDYYDQISLKVINYLNKSEVEPTLGELVINLKLGVKDAKIIVPFINEMMKTDVEINI